MGILHENRIQQRNKEHWVAALHHQMKHRRQGNAYFIVLYKLQARLKLFWFLSGLEIKHQQSKAGMINLL